MTPAILSAAKDLSTWALAIIAIYFIADLVLKGDKGKAAESGGKPSRVWFAKMAIALVFCSFFVVLAVMSSLQPRVGWAPMKQLGDWGGQDTACTKSDTPKLSLTAADHTTLALCDFAHLGQVAVCWGSRFSPPGSSTPAYPHPGNSTQECQEQSAWCTYKSEQAGLLNPNGAAPGKVFLCARLLD
jgi:hypothetical protein